MGCTFFVIRQLLSLWLIWGLALANSLPGTLPTSAYSWIKMDNSDDIQMCTIPADISYPYQTLFYYLRSKFKEYCLNVIMSPWLGFSRQEYQTGSIQSLWLGIPGDHSVFYNQSVRRKKGLENDELVNDEWKYLPQICELNTQTSIERRQ